MIIRLDDDVSLTCSCIAHVPYAARDRHWRKGGVSIHSVHVYVDTRWQGGKVGEVARGQSRRSRQVARGQTRYTTRLLRSMGPHRREINVYSESMMMN